MFALRSITTANFSSAAIAKDLMLRRSTQGKISSYKSAHQRTLHHVQKTISDSYERRSICGFLCRKV